MAYLKTEWADRLDTGNKYRITDNPDGTKTIGYAGDILKRGTPLNAANLNHIEEGIFNATYMVLTVPVQNGTLTYTGETVSPSWIGYDSDKMTIGGVTSAADAGTYTAAFTPIVPWMWSDGTNGAKQAEWSVTERKAIEIDDEFSSDSENAVQNKIVTDALIKLSSVLETPTVSTKPMYYNEESQSPVITGYDSAKMVMSGTASATDAGTYTVTFTPKFPWRWVDGTDTARTVNWEIHTLPIYGAEWDGTSTTQWTRTNDAAGFGACNPYIADASSYSSPFDNIMPWAGMVKEERAGGTMVKIPKFYYKLTQTANNGMKIQIANKAVSGYSVSPAHTDRGDGRGERDYVYVGRYHCALNTYKSTAGVKPHAHISRAAFRANINNLGKNIWQADFAMRFTIWLLYLVEFADWDSQKCIGHGCGTGYSLEIMGYTDSMPYHTGTTQTTREKFGYCTQYRNIEGLWDNCCDWADGCYNDSSGMNIILDPNNFSDISGGISVGIPISGRPSKFEVKNVSGTFPMFIPSESNATSITHSCDDWFFRTDMPCVYIGGDFSSNRNNGLFHVSSQSTEIAYDFHGSRIMELP